MNRSFASMTHAPNNVARDRRISPRRVAWLFAPGMIALSLAAARAPLPQGLDGMTLCFPIIGPVMRIDSSLTGERSVWLSFMNARTPRSAASLALFAPTPPD